MAAPISAHLARHLSLDLLREAVRLRTEMELEDAWEASEELGEVPRAARTGQVEDFGGEDRERAGR